MQHRRIRIGSSAGLGPTAVVGLGLGIAAGFILGELFGGQLSRQTIRRAIGRFHRPDSPRPLEPPADLPAQLARALGPEAATLELVRVGRHGLELRGWVTSRASRSRATRLVRQALPAGIALVDRLLVLGDDDRPIPDPALRQEPEPG